jgi:hypothetical protein
MVTCEQQKVFGGIFSAAIIADEFQFIVIPGVIVNDKMG